MTDDPEMIRRVHDDLVRIDAYHTLLGASLVEFLDMGFDPDAVYTPLEHEIKNLACDLGLDWRVIADESHELAKARRRVE